MVLRISGLKLRPGHTEEELRREIGRFLKLRDGTFSYEIMRRSVDARKKPEIWYVYTVDVTAEHPQSVIRNIRSKKLAVVDKKEYFFPFCGQKAEDPGLSRPVIVGSGPAGLFCALMLARAGLKPLVLERGEAVEERVRTVRLFWEGGPLNPESNVQFGEGGAGTFSDGKLNTLIKDPDGRIRFVLKEFVRAGAKEEILYHHRPHIGTDVLVGIVKNLREEIKSLGGKFRFSSCLTRITPVSGSGASARFLLTVNHGRETIPADQVILAIGHSARDTFAMLYGLGLPMQAKSFAVGFRVEHPQRWIDEAMYGRDFPRELGAAPYKLTHKCGNGRGVYSFCMCPGGYVVNASSEPGMTAVNGMSYSGRDSENANSAVVVTVSPADYGADHPLSGLQFQRRLEQAAWQRGGGLVPVQRFEDFCAGTATVSPGSIRPLCKGGYAPASLRGILSADLEDSIIEGMHAFGKRIPGFDHPDVILSGVESRTSSPVRILRGDACQSTVQGLFPCGEGAGYAGGITSAAVDGIRVAEAVCRARRE